MEDHDHSVLDAQPNDIVQQRYKGASPVVAGLGESLVHGKSLLVGGIILGGIAGALFPTRVGAAMDGIRSYVTKMHESSNHLVHGAGGFIKWSLNTGTKLIDWVRGFKSVENGISKLEKNDPARRVATAIDSAIVSSALLSTVGFVTGFFSGTRHSSAGKNQFEQAKSEITTLRAKNTQLRDKLIETQFALEDYKTIDAAKHGSLTVAKDNTPAISPSPVIHTAQANLLDSISSLSADEHARTN